MKQIYEDLLKKIPDYSSFLTADEMDESSRKLASEYPDIVELFSFGKSRAGHDLLCLKVGSGSKNALVFGLPHPNEPIGTAMIEFFSRQLAENESLRNELDYTWYFVKAWDRDGYELNSGWIKGPYTLYQYSRNFFRPAARQQVDWTFPIDYKDLHFHDVMPEAEAMMHLIDQVRPHMIYSLHNSGFGGVYWYVTYDIPHAIYDTLYEAPRRNQLPIHFGEPESPALKQFYPAVFEGGGIQVEYDYLEKFGVQDIPAVINSGTCSDEYAYNLCKSLTFLTEMPYFYDARIQDLTPSDTKRKEAILEKCRWTLASNQRLREAIAPIRDIMQDDNPFFMAIMDHTKDQSTLAQMKMAQEDPAYDVPATEAEKFDNLYLNRFYRLLTYGMLIRAHEWELERLSAQGCSAIEQERLLKSGLDNAISMHAQLADTLEHEFQYSVIPIRKLVAVQLECGLKIAEYVKTL